MELNAKEYLGFGDYKFTLVEHFGYSFEDFLGGKPVPSHGAHINLTAVGSFKGPSLKAEMLLIDHVLILPNGRIELNVQGVLVDTEGRKLNFQAGGVAQPAADGTLPLVENVHIHSNHETYAWMNTIQIWGRGVVDPKDMSLQVHLFAA